MQANSREEILQQWPAQALALESAQAEALGTMMDAYMQRMQICNFTAHRTPERFALFNVIDSVLPYLQGQVAIPARSVVADIGTGGGFPGVPLAVLQPGASFFLFDSVGKKLRVIDDVCAELTMKNVQTRQLRLEEHAQAEGRERYDVVTSRAVAHWTTLLELALPLLKLGGMLYAYQGEKIFEELEASRKVIDMLGGELLETASYDLGEGGVRYIIAIKKVRHTHPMYPRLYTDMSRKPL